MTTGFADCLVLKIQEVCSVSNEVDVEMFVLYDQDKENYIIRGCRTETSGFDFNPFSFVSESSRDVYDFIHTIISHKNKVNVTLYNYDNLPKTSDEITFESLVSDEDVKSEIVGFDDMLLNNKSWLLRTIRSLRYVYNH